MVEEGESQDLEGGGAVGRSLLMKCGKVMEERRGVEQVLEAVAAITVGTVREIVEEVMGRDLHRAH